MRSTPSRATRGDSAQALGVLLETSTDPPDRLELYPKLAEIEETSSRRPAARSTSVLRALTEFPAEIALWDRADAARRARSARPTDLAEAYRSVPCAQTPTFPRTSRSSSASAPPRCTTRSSAIPKARRRTSSASSQQEPGDERAFARLKQILTSAEKWGELEVALRRTPSRARPTPTRRVDLLNEVALVCEEIINEPGKAIGYYESILELDSTHENATRALEKLYAREGR